MERLANALSWGIFGAIAIGAFAVMFDLLGGVFDPTSGTATMPLALIAALFGLVCGGIYGATSGTKPSNSHGKSARRSR